MCKSSFTFLLLSFFSLFVIAQESKPDKKQTEIDTSEYINGDINFNLLIACSYGYDEEVLRLLNTGANINTRSEDGVTPLMYASANGYLKTVKVLILNGTDVNLKPYNGSSAIISATRENLTEIVEELLIAGANVNDHDKYGATPLLYASAYNYYLLCDMLLYYGADPDFSDIKLTSPLMAAIYAGNITVADLLLKEGADINHKDTKGITSLIIAAQNGDTSFVKFLLDRGADLNAKSRKGNSAFYSALYNGYPDVLDQLWEYGLYEKKDELKTPDPYTIGQFSNNKDVKVWLSDHEFKTSFKPVIASGFFGGVISINPKDFFLGAHLGLEELYTGLSAEFDFKFRPAMNRILWEIDPQTYYQFWEKRNMIAFTLGKKIKITPLSVKFLIGAYGGIRGTYSFGPKYSGTEIEAPDYFKVSPNIGFYGESGKFLIRIVYEYLNLGTPESSPHWVNIGLYYRFKFTEKYLSNKSIEWY